MLFRSHLTVIKTPTQARHAIGYCLGNWRHHGEDQVGMPSTWLVDPFSSAISFPDWAEMGDQPCMWPIRETYDPLMVRRPQTWLLREGWKVGGHAISARDVPGEPRPQSVGDAGPGVGLVDDDRDPPPPSGQVRRHRDVPTEAGDDVGAEPVQHPLRVGLSMKATIDLSR